MNVLILAPPGLMSEVMTADSRLREDGIVAFVDWSINPDAYAQQMDSMMRASDLVVMFVNADYLREGSRHVTEWKAAVKSHTPKLVLAFDDTKCPSMDHRFTYYRCRELIEAPALVSRYIREKQRRKIFVSYARRDCLHADDLLELISASVSQVWIDRSGIKPGEQFPKAILDAIETSEWFLLLWSRHSMESKWVEKEWRHAQLRQKKIVPILLDATPLPAELSELQAFVSMTDERLYDFLHIADSKRPPVAVGADARLAPDGRPSA
jgi:hypothetical protein